MRTKLILAVAVLAIIFGLYGLAGNLTRPTDSSSLQTAQPLKFYSVWQVRSQVSATDVVRPEHLQVLKIQEDDAALQGIAEDMLFEYPLGSIYRSDMAEGSLLYPTDIVAPNSPEYLDLTLADGYVPYPLKVSPEAVVGGVIRASSYIDILALTSPTNVATIEVGSSATARGKAISISPVLMGVKVLRVDQSDAKEATGEDVALETHLILELDRKQVSILSVAKQIATLEVHKSVGNYRPADLSADAGDVLPGFKSVIEYRADAVTIK
ncbi:Flp pilus assembly protein CpaB [Vibrio sp. 16]|uniref:Flp pilus assembly protein CpaB n=1 Tax=Vibrio sp. 16 TaxID=391586 RepID=UPI00018F2BE8|nr:Flp pilus assembly protein CpaB [Vibrio sp. 16]EED27844.1 Flp pilus assembly protein CpaB [Vibrio sp. 16]CAK4067532.1 hypothetical protein VDT1_0609 [Vibrio sp. 16]